MQQDTIGRMMCEGSSTSQREVKYENSPYILDPYSLWKTTFSAPKTVCERQTTTHIHTYRCRGTSNCHYRLSPMFPSRYLTKVPMTDPNMPWTMRKKSDPCLLG